MNQKGSFKGLIFTRLEKSSESKYPNFIKDILIHTGYNSSATIKIIDKNAIETIEKYINDNFDDIEILLKDTLYLDSNGNLKKTPFKFLIGHISLILNLPKDLNQYFAKKVEIVTIKKTKEIPPTEELKKTFNVRVKEYTDKKKIKIDLNKISVVNFSSSNNRVKCLAQCPFCSIKFVCYFDSCWRTSNFFKHIVSCSKNKVQSSAPITSSTTNPTTSPTNSLIRAKQGVLRQVENLA